MKYLTTIFVTLFFHLQVGFAQSEKITIESILMNCIIEAYKDIEVDIEKELERFENHLIEREVLESPSGQSYFDFFKVLEKGKDFPTDLEYEIIEDIVRLGAMELYKLSCIDELNALSSKLVAKSKHTQLTLGMREAARDELSPANLAKVITRVLNPTDFDHPYYRATTLLTIANIFHLETGFTKNFEHSYLENYENAEAIMISLTDDNQIIVNEEPIGQNELKKLLVAFISLHKSNHVIFLQTDRGVLYEFFIIVHNQIASAYKYLRDEMAKDLFGKTFDELTDIQKKEIVEVYPIRVKE